MQRDSLASHIGHSSRLLYFSTAENVSPARMRVKFLNVDLSDIENGPAGWPTTCQRERSAAVPILREIVMEN